MYEFFALCISFFVSVSRANFAEVTTANKRLSVPDVGYAQCLNYLFYL